VPVGTAAGLQFAAVLKSLEPGLASQVAFCARAGGAVDIMPMAKLAATGVNRRTPRVPRAAMPPRPTPTEVSAYHPAAGLSLANPTRANVFTGILPRFS
jgi:hypothetical protein